MKPGHSSGYGFMLERAKRYCSYQERSLFDVRNRLKDWNLRESIIDKIIMSLRKEGYVDEQRFARIFAGSKFRINKWGRNKIIQELQRKHVPDLMIHIGLEEIDDEEYIATLKSLITRKSFEIKEDDPFTAHGKLAAYAISKGYEPDIVWNIIKEKD